MTDISTDIIMEEKKRESTCSGKGVKIKICGLTAVREAEYLNEAQIDFAGFIQFVPKSRRNIPTELAREIIRELDPSVRSVAVTISPDLETVRRLEAAGFDYLQIHGQVEPAVWEHVSMPVIRAYNYTDMGRFAQDQLDSRVRALLVDAAVPGSGKTFDWAVLDALPVRSKPLFLAGGLHAGNVREAILRVKPDVVDVSSGVENESGAGKNRQKILELARAVLGGESI